MHSFDNIFKAAAADAANAAKRGIEFLGGVSNLPNLTTGVVSDLTSLVRE